MVAAVLLLYSPWSASAVVTDAIWAGGDGTWSTAAKWSTGVVPNNNALTNYVVRIDNGNATSSIVTQTTASLTVTIDRLVLDAGDQLRLNNGANLIVTNGPGGGIVANAGTITVNGTGSGTDVIVSGGAVTLTGGGAVLLGNNINSRLRGAADTDLLINDDNTISGAGQIGYDAMGLENRGTITASEPTVLIIDPSVAGARNTGWLQSTNGALLRLLDGVFTNSLGTIRALNTSTVEVNEATIVGGLLTTEGSGVIRGAVGHTSTLANLRNTGKLLFPNGVNFMLTGVITNAGTFQLEGASSASDLIVSGGPVTLTGGGTITLGNHVNNRLYGATATDVLINEDNTITGAGNIGLDGMGLDNRGTIIASQPTQLLIDPDDTTGFVNRGTLQANAGSTLYVTGAGFSNFIAGTSTLTGGTYRVAGTLKFQDASIVNNAAAIILDGATSTIVDHLGTYALGHLGTNSGSFVLQNGRSFSLSNAFVNSGSLRVATADSSLSVGPHRYTQAAGSTVIHSSLVLGDFGCAVTGVVEVTGGSLLVTNATLTAVLEVRSGTLTQTGGELRVDQLVITNACGRFLHTGGVFLPGTVVIDPDLDADGDGLANSFEQGHGLDPFDPRDAAEDDDADGVPNIFEMLAGTDPQDNASVFRILTIIREGTDIRIDWLAGGGRTNVVTVATGSITNQYLPVSPNIIIPGSSDVITNYLDPDALTNATPRFYRVRVLP